MKTFLTIIFVISAVPLFSQNINNTLGVGGSFNILDGNTTFFNLSQSSGYIHLSKIGLFKGIQSFIHDYQAPGTDGSNTFIGLNAGNFSMSGSGYSFDASYNTAVGNFSLTSLTKGSYNSAFGISSLYSNTIGYVNSAFGYSSLYSNTGGNYNSAFGANSLYSNTTGNENSAFGHNSLTLNTTGNYNSAFGSYSLSFSTTGSYNSVFGFNSLLSNTTGSYNSAFGYYSLYSNTEGYYNSAFGLSSLHSNTTGAYNSSFGYHSLYSNTISVHNSAFGSGSLYSNTEGRHNSAFGSGSLYSNTTGVVNSAFGVNALFSNTTGNNNTAVGLSAGYDITTGSNNIAIGFNAQVPSPTADNQVRLGNDSITYAGIQVAWTITSDRRWKDDILPSNLGLDFISSLNPVSYIRKNDENQRLEYGFIAQEIEEVLKKYGAASSGMITIDDKGYYELRYNDLFAPIVKAVQELKSENELLKNKLAELYESVASMADEKAKEVLQISAKPFQHSSKISLDSDINKTSE